MVWNLFYTVATGSMAALVGAGPLLRKIYFPAYAPVAGNAVSALVQTAIELGLLLAVYVLLSNIAWTVLLVPVLLALLAAFSLGVGLVPAISTRATGTSATSSGWVWRCSSTPLRSSIRSTTSPSATTPTRGCGSTSGTR